MFDKHPRPAAIAAVLLAMLSITTGASLAQSLFDQLGPGGTTALRVGFAALMLVIWRKPWQHRLTTADWQLVAGYGAVLGLMNLCFYHALKTLPLGIAIAIEFTGPLLVALSASRRMLDVVWVLLAAAGLLLLLPLTGGRGLDPLGVGFAFAAGAFWAAYIILGQAAGRLPSSAATAWGMCIAALAVMPFGIYEAGPALLDINLWPLALGVALFSSALPYSLEMFALPRLPRHAFGVLMSVEPAIGTLAGFLLLHQSLTPRQLLAIACIVAASAGSTLWRSNIKPVPEV